MSDYGIKTYADLAETCCGMVLANEIANRPLEPVSGDWAPLGRDIPVVHRPGPELPHGAHRRAGVLRRGAGVYVWGITHFGTSWDYVPAPEIH